MKYVAGNWKMFTTATTARALAEAVAKGVTSDTVRVSLCPPFPYLGLVIDSVRGSRVSVGAQNCYPAKEGAFTGEVSPQMLFDLGCEFVIIGHSERRHIIGESDAFINQKVKSVLSVDGLRVIFCIGEKLEERDANLTNEVLHRQVLQGLADIDAQLMKNVIIAYEPVWAIGTGRNATPDQAQKAHFFVRQLIAQHWNSTTSDRIIIQYGGSVKPDNAAALMSQPDVDGALVGGASLQAESFLSIVRAAAGK